MERKYKSGDPEYDQAIDDVALALNLHPERLALTVYDYLNPDEGDE